MISLLALFLLGLIGLGSPPTTLLLAGFYFFGITTVTPVTDQPTDQTTEKGPAIVMPAEPLQP